MKRFEYLTAKMYEFGSDQAEMKRPNEYWVSDYGLLDLLQKLGAEGWEAVCNVGRDIVFKREATGDSIAKAVVEMHEKAAVAK